MIARRNVGGGPNQNTLKPAFPKPVPTLPSTNSAGDAAPIHHSRPKLKVAALGPLMSGSAKTRTIPSIGKPSEKEWDLVVTAVENSREVWVQPQSSGGILKELETNMLRKHVSSKGFSGGSYLDFYLILMVSILSLVRSDATWELLQR